MKDLLIKNGTVVTEDSIGIFDVLCSNGIIKQIEPHIDPASQEKDIEYIDASGKTVIPGGVDVHTHLNLDTGSAVACDDFYTGTVAAAFGGTTAIVDHVGFGPKGCPLDHQIKKYHNLAGGKAIIDYSFHGVIQHVDDDVLQKIETLQAEGITSFKIYLTYDFKLNDSDAYRVLEKAKQAGAIITVHPENHDVIRHLREKYIREGKTGPAYHPLSRPMECEAEAINRMILLAKMTGDAPLYIVHLSNRLGLEYIREARKMGQKNLFAETCPQYLFLDDSLYSGGLSGLKYIMCPPLRKKEDAEALWLGLDRDINTIATDHCPFVFKTQKMAGKDDFTKCPSGAPGVEERIPLLFSEGVMKKRITLRRFTDLCAANPAKIFGMYPQKGVIKEGADADIVIMDPEKKTVLGKNTIHGNVDYSAYEGMEITGFPEYTISRGEIIINRGILKAEAGRGNFIPRKSYGGLPHLS